MEGKGWVNAEDLKTGMRVYKADGTTGTVWLKWNVYKTQEMYNLTVDTAHTFFVGEGQWLVHNCGGRVPLANGATELPDGVSWQKIDDLTPTHSVNRGLDDLVRTNDVKMSISANGYDPNQAVRAVEMEDGSLWVWQGHHRVEAVEELGYSELPVIIYEYFLE